MKMTLNVVMGMNTSMSFRSAGIETLTTNWSVCGGDSRLKIGIPFRVTWSVAYTFGRCTYIRGNHHIAERCERQRTPVQCAINVIAYRECCFRDTRLFTVGTGREGRGKGVSGPTLHSRVS